MNAPLGSPADNAPESDAEKSSSREMSAAEAREFIANPTKFLESLAAELLLQPELEGKELWTTHVSINTDGQEPEERPPDSPAE